MAINVEKRPLLVIAGPTACGKTATAVHIAKITGGEIISADSMQVYKYMDIGTAKPSAKELADARHHLIDILSPDEAYSAAVFCSLGKAAYDDILSRGKLPILAGGTGFYTNAFIYGNQFHPAGDNSATVDYSYRESLYALAAEQGSEALHNLLRKVDPVSADNIHHHNVKRVARALEFHRHTGKKISEHNELERKRLPAYDVKMFILHMDRALLYERIEKRIDRMVTAGLVDEVKKLLDMGYGEELVSMKGLGYKEIIPYLKGEQSLEQCVEILKRDTRRFAKRQITWFKNQCDGTWMDMAGFDTTETAARNIVRLAGFDGEV